MHSPHGSCPQQRCAAPGAPLCTDLRGARLRQSSPSIACPGTARPRACSPQLGGVAEHREAPNDAPRRVDDTVSRCSGQHMGKGSVATACARSGCGLAGGQEVGRWEHSETRKADMLAAPGDLSIWWAAFLFPVARGT